MDKHKRIGRVHSIWLQHTENFVVVISFVSHLLFHFFYWQLYTLTSDNIFGRTTIVVNEIRRLLFPDRYPNNVYLRIESIGVCLDLTTNLRLIHPN